MFCQKCGAEYPDGASFCKECGEALDHESPKSASTSINLEPNVAGLLCYALGWITGLIFLLIEKENKFVRFHALQSIYTFGAFTLFWIIFSIIMDTDIRYVDKLFSGLNIFSWLLAFVIWVVLMVKAYQHEQYKLPWVGDLAER